MASTSDRQHRSRGRSVSPGRPKNPLRAALARVKPSSLFSPSLKPREVTMTNPTEASHDFSDIDSALRVVAEYEEIGETLKLVTWLVEASAASLPADAKFANTTASIACFARAALDLQAAVTLAGMNFYTQAMGQLRSAYEAATIGRTMAHSPKVAEKWMNGEWQPDAKARQFVENVMYGGESTERRQQAKQAYADSYEHLSTWAHVTTRSTLHLLTESDPGYTVQLVPKFDESFLRYVMDEITKETVFTAYALRNSVADLSVLPNKWLDDLDDLGTRAGSGYIVTLARGRQEHQERHKTILDNLRANSELNPTLKRHPGSLDNLRRSRD